MPGGLTAPAPAPARKGLRAQGASSRPKGSGVQGSGDQGLRGSGAQGFRAQRFRGSGAQGLNFRAGGSGLRYQGPGLRSSGLRLQGQGLRSSGLGSRGSGFSPQGSGREADLLHVYAGLRQAVERGKVLRLEAATLLVVLLSLLRGWADLLPTASYQNHKSGKMDPDSAAHIFCRDC